MSTPMDTPYMYIFIREDLTPAQKIVQAAHASLEAGFAYNKPDTCTHIVLLGAKNQDDLLSIQNRLITHDISFQIFYEPDYDTGYTAIATIPLVGDDRAPLKRYSLFRG